VLLIGIALFLCEAGWVAFGGLGLFGGHLLWQVARIDINDSALCLRLFKSNRDAGLVLFAALVIDGLLRVMA